MSCIPEDSRRRIGVRWLLTCISVAALAVGIPAAAADPQAAPVQSPDMALQGSLSGVGDPAMAGLMDRWLAALHNQHPQLVRGTPWRYNTAAVAVASLMFEVADMGALTRMPTPAEVAPYAHQFAGDMMKTPLMIRVAGTAEHPAYIAVNKRPGSPLPPKVSSFIGFALSREGQAIVAADGRFAPLDSSDASAQLALIAGELAPLDAALPTYHATTPVVGEIRSVGSDGMKTLMDRWMRDFTLLQPGVKTGSRWEHLGTLNGFHALLLRATDLAPMGRELWPSEREAYASVFGNVEPLEIRVARGGFNTPQRTTAQAIFVHQRNPLRHISVEQLADIFSARPRITRWGQLGLHGEWANRPIVIRMPPKVAPNSMSMQISVLHGGDWNPAVLEAPIAATAAAIAAEPGAIGFGGFEEGGLGLRTVAVSQGERDEPVTASVETTSSGRYPLTRYMYIRINREPGKPLPPAVREFLRYVLSRDAQEPILYSGYFPLTAKEVGEELAKLQ